MLLGACIDPRNPGHASDIAPEILEELEHFGSVELEPARTPLPNGNDEAAIAAIDAEVNKPALDRGRPEADSASSAGLL
jgi:hypothetical protein